MKLKKVQIRNFRSIKSIDIEFDPSCLILVGINESGKTNILKAIRLIDPDIETSPEDVRQSGYNDDLNESSYVRFVFEFDNQEIEKFYDEISSKIAVNKKESGRSPIYIKTKTKSIDLMTFLQDNNEVLYRVDLREDSKVYQNWYIRNLYTIVGSWYKALPNEPSYGMSVIVDGEEHRLGDFRLIEDDFIDKEISQGLQKASAIDLINLYNSIKSKFLADHHPSSIYWSFLEDNLLPEKVDLRRFMSDPDICLPLKYIFMLSGIESSEIGSTITSSIKAQSGLRNLLNRVAHRASTYLHESWPDYSNISFELSPNGDSIDCLIKDKYNSYGLSSRSDGFKRFITFLISVSVRAHTADLKEVIFIQDEPDTSLHPSAVKRLLQEIIKLSLTNTVIFSTHSIFMIDKENIGRHIIVKKEDEITKIEKVDSSNIVDEEVIYNALGHSIFEIIRQKNIIFEGWKDKNLFSKSIDYKSLTKSQTKALKEIGTCHAFGVKDVERVENFLQLANRDWIIISDGDSVAREKQRKYRGGGIWVRYDELLGIDSEITMEDFFDPGFIRFEITKLIGSEYGGKSFDELILSDDIPVLKSISAWLSRNDINGDNQKAFINNIKENLSSNFTVSQITPRYFSALKRIVEIIK